MNRAANINAALILIVSLVFTAATAGLVAGNEGQIAYDWGFILGRALAGALAPLVLVVFVRFVFRRKPLLSKWAIVTWWVLFVFMSVMALLGNMLPPEANGP